MPKPTNYRAKAAEACIRFAAVLDEIHGIKAQIGKAMAGCEMPFDKIHKGGDIEMQSHLGRYFDNGGRLPVDSWLGEEPEDDIGSDIFDCEACMKAYALCIQRKKLRQKRGQALRLVRYYGRKAGEQSHG
ncbi:hypothetical protein D3C76_135000 [compost metagenome]